jgi:hypothetical protein
LASSVSFGSGREVMPSCAWVVSIRPSSEVLPSRVGVMNVSFWVARP